MKIEKIGQMDNTIDNTLESANRVYSVGGYALPYRPVAVEISNQR